jgi:hypothetical protein
MIIEMHESLLGKVDRAASKILQQAILVCQSRFESPCLLQYAESQVIKILVAHNFLVLYLI